jgi:hypothetical protein
MTKLTNGIDIIEVDSTETKRINKLLHLGWVVVEN